MKSPEAKEAANKGVEQLYRSGKYSDLTLEFKGRKFPVHKFWVCPRSKTIKAQCDGGFKEGTTGIISIQAPSATCKNVERMLDFLYCYSYDCHPTLDEVQCFRKRYEESIRGGLEYLMQRTLAEQQDNRTADCGPGSQENLQSLFDKPRVQTACETASRLINIVHLWALGDYYDIADLKTFTERMFKWDLKDDVAYCFAPVVCEVYEYAGASADFRNKVVEFAADNSSVLGKDEYFLATVAEITDFTVSMMRESIVSYQKEISTLKRNFAEEEKRHARDLKQASADIEQLRLNREHTFELTSTLNTISKCSGCHWNVGALIKPSQSGNGWTVSCRHCKGPLKR